MRTLVRFLMLMVLTVTTGLVYMETPVSAARDCATAVFNKWTTCDNAYASTAQQYAIRTPHCVQTAPSACPNQTTETYCSSLDPSQYAGCCLAASRASCENAITATYDGRGSSYGSCMEFGGNYGNCIEEVADFCLDAQGRNSVCAALYEGTEDFDARSTCIANSGVDLCQ